MIPQVTTTFTDVQTNDWFAPYVSNLVDRGALSGYPDGTFGSSKQITVGEFIKAAISTAEDGSFYAGNAYDGHWAVVH